ncbi:MAG: hypothetical protein PVI97_12285 [Candidatus Thiodiazotropha sp.]
MLNRIISRVLWRTRSCNPPQAGWPIALSMAAWMPNQAKGTTARETMISSVRCSGSSNVSASGVEMASSSPVTSRPSRAVMRQAW